MRASRGEILIEKILTEAGLKFEMEYSFPGLNSSNGKPLRFNFVVFDDDGNIDFIIEYQGRQHYEIGSGWSNENHLQRTQKHDQMKRDYCKQNNIKLVEIPYTDFDKIDIQYLNKKYQEVKNI